MREVIVNEIDATEDEIIEGIKSIVRIKSVQETAKHGKPYGEGIHLALMKTLELAKSLGFEVEDIDGQVGIAKYGEGENYLGIFGHLDVVPEGEGWNHSPYSAYEDEHGRIYSRGILDNKGPILANLYALYVLKKLGIQPQIPIWIVFGTNEETGFHDMEYFLTKKKAPMMGWTPDCKWPVVYAERGRGKYKISINGNTREKFDAFVKKYLENKNTILQMLDLEIHDEEFGEMQLREIKISEDEVNFTLSYPASITSEKIMETIKSKLPKELILTCISNYNPVFFDKESVFCKGLQRVYEEITGLDGTPVTTTGGTYAKVVPNILPFGPSFPGQKGIGHLPNEWMDRKDIIKCAKIYALSMYDLVNKK